MKTEFIADLWIEVRHGMRQLRRSPAFTLVSVAALSIGVGANITIFSFVNAWLLRPIDAVDPSRVIRVTGPGGDQGHAGATEDVAHIPPKDYVQYRDRNQSFTTLAASHIGGPMRVRIDGPVEIIPVTPVTGNYFQMLGVTASIGRTLTPDDGRPGAREAIVLTDAGWRRFFSKNPNVVGTTAIIDDIPHTVVGVLPSWFTGTYAPMVPQIYRPIIERSGSTTFNGRLQLMGRLKPGVSPEAAHADLLRIAAQLTQQDNERRSIEIYPARSVVPFMLRGVSVISLVFVLIVGVVLLVACDNIAILTTIRSAVRTREISLRLALGASRPRLLLQLLIESGLLCVAGGLVGVYFAYTTAQFATQFYMPVPMPFALTYTVDWRVGGFAVGLSCIAMLLCGLGPALKALKTDLVAMLRGVAIPGTVRSDLIVTQVALSTMLLVTAVVLVHSVYASLAQDRGFTSERVAMTTVALPRDGTPLSRVTFLETLLERVEHAPGVAAATIVENIPLANNSPIASALFRADGRQAQVSLNRVSRGLFDTLEIALLAGRDFTGGDNSSAAAVGIVNETLARTFWREESPIGKFLKDKSGALVEIVGLARDSKYDALEEPSKPFLYRPLAQAPTVTPTFLIKAIGDRSTVIDLVRTRLAELDSTLAAFNVMALDDRLALGLVMNRAAATVSGSLGLLALLLGSVGIYGTMSYLARQRQREIGIRLALGASYSQVIRLITSQGMVWVGGGLAVGLALGLIAALGLSRVVRGVSPTDPLAFVVTPLVLAAAGYLACHLPARRASRLDPLVALRDE